MEPRTAALRLFTFFLEVYTAAPEVVKRFNPKFRLLLDACGAANVDVVPFILDSHDSSENHLPLGTVDLHQRDDSGDTPILAAAGSLMVPLQSRTTKGHTHDVATLHLAASGPGEFDYRLLDKQLRITETLRLLLDHDSTGINLVLTTLDPRRCTMLLYATADPRIPDGSGCTILHLLGYHSHQGDPVNTTLLDLILSQGANINHTENYGKTALHAFAQNLRQVSAAKFLIEHGTDFRVRNTLQETPFHTAARGFLNDHIHRDGRDEEVTAANKVRLQDEMLRALMDAAGEDTAILMSQPNAEGKTPQDLLEPDVGGRE
ncbi:hypothetical protein N7520_009359 [Penicillium odoratum]|uniref:uncharacterized protein n=1 Tax=Penicillium odoratum TaxID=1167516 RepID=UPI002547E920|nr:uncharacterized protein N7520_009359 [Penicillium odoratum]KAJ5752442.1 hypothetical protein N7520_009359 [Penicillium odoratum]